MGLVLVDAIQATEDLATGIDLPDLPLTAVRTRALEVAA
jgi:hypothetical protein